jgi:hypothetical protein
MGSCKHKWEMADIRYGYLVIEGCPKCGGRSSFFSEEPVPPVDEYREGDHFWIYMGSSQALKFNFKCTKCKRLVNLEDMMGLMMSTCEDPQCKVAQIGLKEGKGTMVYVALCADSKHTSGKCVSAKGIKALNEYFNQNIKASGKKIVIVPCDKCCNIDKCEGIVITDTGLTDMY